MSHQQGVAADDFGFLTLIQVLDGPLSDQVHRTKGTNQQIVGWNPQD